MRTSRASFFKQQKPKTKTNFLWKMQRTLKKPHTSILTLKIFSIQKKTNEFFCCDGRVDRWTNRWTQWPMESRRRNTQLKKLKKKRLNKKKRANMEILLTVHFTAISFHLPSLGFSVRRSKFYVSSSKFNPSRLKSRAPSYEFQILNSDTEKEPTPIPADPQRKIYEPRVMLCSNEKKDNI